MPNLLLTKWFTNRNLAWLAARANRYKRSSLFGSGFAVGRWMVMIVEMRRNTP